MLHYEIKHCDFSSRFKKIRQENSICLGQYILLRDTLNSQRAIAKITQYHNTQSLTNILQQTQQLLIITNTHHNTFFTPFIGYSLIETKTKKQVYLIYSFHENTLEEQFKNMIIHKKQFSERDIITFIQTMLRNSTQLEKHGLYYGCLNSENILLQSLNSIECTFRMIYLPNMEQNIQSYLNKYSQHPKRHQTITYEDCKTYNLSQIQLTHHLTKLDYHQKLIANREKIGLLALRMLNIHTKNLYTSNQQSNILWNHSQITNILRNNKYQKNICKAIEILLYQQQFYSFQRLENQITNILFPNNNRKLTNSRKSKISYDAKSQTPSKYNLQLSREILLISSSPKQQPNLSIEEIEQKMLFDQQGNPLPRISQKLYGDGGKYVGQFFNDIRSGNGLYYYPEGDVYGGQWKNNNMEGYGMYLFNNGQTYEGQVNNGLKHGYGTYIYVNGNKYTGQWKNDKKYGKGIYQYNHRGDIYQGQFEEGVRNGQGKYQWKNGNIFNGNFLKGGKSGEGQGILSNGTIIKGTWVNDNLEGIIKVKFKRGDQYVGQIRDNKLNGLGNYKYIEGVEYDGQLVDGQKTGKCQIHYPNGDIYQGQIKKGKPEGSGIYLYYSQQIKYQGNWHKGLQNGKGSIIFENGTKIITEWQLGKPSNFGIIIYSNGDQYQGEINSMGRHGKGEYKFLDGRVIEGIFSDGQITS